ncbi:MAG: hypothetical protein OXH86_03700, partial [Acidimicrobiaceae bacterium]|nr:hypothetical protein [Acidimicrobiaceae bacterium]
RLALSETVTMPISACVESFCVPSEVLVTPKRYRSVGNECHSYRTISIATAEQNKTTHQHKMGIVPIPVMIRRRVSPPGAKSRPGCVA